MKGNFAPCPLCKQYSHSLGDDQLTRAYMHFQSMFSHRGDGIPTQYTFDARTRDAAEVLMGEFKTRGTQTVARTPDGILWLYSGSEWRKADTPAEKG